MHNYKAVLISVIFTTSPHDFYADWCIRCL